MIRLASGKGCDGNPSVSSLTLLVSERRLAKVNSVDMGLCRQDDGLFVYDEAEEPVGDE